MENIEILKNPDQKYWDEMLEHLVIEECWVNSTHDYKTEREGFSGNFTWLVAVDKTTQKFVGGICVATFTNPVPLSSLGMYYVLPKHQGKGIGTHLFKEAIKLCAPRKFLYGVESMVAKYRDSYGFNKIPDWHLITARMKTHKVRPLKLEYDPTLTIKTPEACGWNEIAAFHRKLLPNLDISTLGKALLTQPETHSGVAVTNDNRIIAVVRVCQTYNNELSIGPMLGDNAMAVCTALRHVLCQMGNFYEFNSIVLQFPHTNSDVYDLLRRMVEDGDYTLGELSYPQFTDDVIEIPLDQVFAVSHNDGCLV